MRTAYLVTDSDMRDAYGRRWSFGEWVRAAPDAGLCNCRALPFYSDGWLALVVNVMCNGVEDARLWECELRKTGGYLFARIASEVVCIRPTPQQALRFAVLCALAAVKESERRLMGLAWWRGRPPKEDVLQLLEEATCTQRETTCKPAGTA